MVGLRLNIYKLHPIKLFILFILSTGITGYIIVVDSDHPLAFSFVIGYIIYLFLYILYMMIIAFSRIKIIPSFELKKLAVTFCGTFVVLSILSFILTVYIQSNDFSIYDFSIPLGMALGITFMKINSFTVKQNDRVD